MLSESEYALEVGNSPDCETCLTALHQRKVDIVLISSIWTKESLLATPPWSDYPVIVLLADDSGPIPDNIKAGFELIKDSELNSPLLRRMINFTIQHREDEQRWLKRINLEKAIAECSRMLATWSNEPLYPILQLLGEALGADNAAMYRVDKGYGEAFIEEEWNRLPETKLADLIPVVTLSDYPDWIEKFSKHECIIVDFPDATGFNNPNESQDIQEFGLKAGIWIPIVDHSDRFRGCIVVTNSSYHKFWIREDIHTLRIFGELLGTTRERIETTSALAISEENYRHLVENANEAILVAREGKLLYFNDELCKLLGVPRELLPERHYLEYIHPDDRSMLEEYHRRRLSGEDIPNRYSFRTYDGINKSLWVEANLVLIQWEGVPAVLCFLTDITTRKDTEDKLLASRQEFRSLYNSTLVGLYRTSIEDGRILALNKRTSEMFGFDSPEEMAASTRMQDFYVDPGARQTMITTIREKGHIDNFETPFRKRDGSIFWARFSARVFLEHGYLENVITDISDEKATREALDETQTKYSELFNSVQEGIGIVNQEEIIEFCNPAFARIFDADSSEELVGRSLLEFVDENNRSLVIRQTDQRKLMNASRYELEIVTGSGIHKTIAVSVSPRLDRNGNFLGAFGSVLDITDRKITEEALRESEERLKIILESVPTAIVIVDPDSQKIVDANAAAANILGIERLQLLGQSCQKIVCHSDKGPCRFASADKSINNIETELPRVDGKQISVLKSIASVQLNGRRHLVECFTDLTELKKQEKDLYQLSAAVSQSPIMILITDPNGIIEYINPHFTDVTGYSQKEILGKTPAILYSGKQTDNFYESMWETIKSGGTWVGNLQNRRKSGEIFWERESISPIFNIDGEIINFLAIGNDITHEIISQQKLAESDKLSAIGMLAAGVAHEFKNYLGGIIGNASFAIDHIDESDGCSTARETLEQIVEMGDKANEVAMSLLSYSKAKPEDRTHESLAHLIEKSISLVEKEMRNRTIEIARYIEDVPTFEMSASKIQQLFLNLLINAQHAIKTNGVITVALMNAGDRAVIKVGDSGTGIPEDKLERIFDPFYSTKGVWGRDELVGTGMGLSISRNIAREHGGDITVESIEGIGSTFIITLPYNTTAKDNNLVGIDYTGHKILFFTLDKSIISRYHQRACETNTRLLVAGSIDDAPIGFEREIDLVVCDAHFTGKVELLQMAQMCMTHSIRYVMVNCNVMEYQLAELFDGAATNFRDFPDLDRLLAVIKSDKSPATGA